MVCVYVYAYFLDYNWYCCAGTNIVELLGQVLWKDQLNAQFMIIKYPRSMEFVVPVHSAMQRKKNNWKWQMNKCGNKYGATSVWK